MKKVLLLLTLLVLALALVACGGEKNPPVTEPPATQAPSVTTAPPAVTTASAAATYSVKFMDAEMFKDENGEQIVLSELTVRRGKFARAPRDPAHDGYIFTGWDVDDFSSITSDMVITAQYRALDTYTLEFYDDAGKLLSTVEVKEGEAAVEPATVLKPGYIFTGWDKPVGRVDRAWADFDAYKDLADEERAETKMVFKTTAVYEEADGTIPFVENVTFELKEEQKDGKTVYVPADFDKFSEGYVYQELAAPGYAAAGVAADAKFNQVKATTHYAWDGEYVYGYVIIEDPTLLSRGTDYVFGMKDPWQNDVLEYWFTMGAAPTSAFHQRFTVDFYGLRHTAYDGMGDSGSFNSMSKYFDQMEYKSKVVESEKTSYIFFKLVAKAETGEKLQAGSVHYVAPMLDDIRDLNDLTNMYCSTSNHINYEEGWERYTLGGQKTSTGDSDVTTQPNYEEYYPLYVQDGLVYHINFAEATEDIVIAPKNPDAELAHFRFAAAADTYDKFIVGAKEGITAPWAGGTATISEGGWKFTTPFVYDYWFEVDGSLKTSRPSPVSTFDHFVTEEGVAGAPYYMNGDAYVKAEAGRKIGEETKPLYQLVHTAPEGATGYYIPNGIWAAPTYSSAFGNGYFDAMAANNIIPFNGKVKTVLSDAKAYSVELVAASPNNQKAAYFIGPRFEFTPKADSVAFTGSAGFDMLATDSGYETITMPLSGSFINTYAMTFDLADIANYNYTLNAYGNGTNYSAQTVKSKTNTFSVTGNGQYLMRAGSGLHTYAFRVYEKQLSANEVLQNHFADIAIFNALDITEFNALSDAQKLSVYKAFDGVVIDDVNLQDMLDGAIAAIKSTNVN